MVKADAPVPENKEKKAITPPETDTPAEKPEGVPTPPTPQEKKIAELGGEVDRLTGELKKQEKITKTAQKKEKQHERKMNTLRKTLEDIRSGKLGIEEIPPEDETLEEKDVRQEARIGIQNLFIGNPAYQKLLEKDRTLREVIKNNPLALVGDYLDAEDAVGQMKDKLDEMVSTSKDQPEVEKKKGEEGEPPEFETPAQPGGEPPEPPKEKEDKKPPKSSEPRLGKIEDSIKSKIKFT